MTIISLRLFPCSLACLILLAALPAAVLLACGSYFLAPVGAAMAQKLDVAPLKRIFGLLLLGLGLKMLFSVL